MNAADVLDLVDWIDDIEARKWPSGTAVSLPGCLPQQLPLISSNYLDRLHFKFIPMHPLSLTLMLCGLILLLSYLVLLLPTERKIYTTREAFDHSIGRLRDCIAQMRKTPKQ